MGEYKAHDSNEKMTGEDGLTDPPECTLNIVCQNEVNGNGMQTRDDEWVLVKPLLTSLIIMSPPWRGGDEGK
uniref:Uncharacterized protein n=1 Tax=Oryza nivara TaxID=4536 RepID=A0A0E0FL30_ORYNI